MALNNADKKKPSQQDRINALLAGAPSKDKGLAGHAQDLGLSALSSAISVPELAVGVANLATGGRAGKFLENQDGAFGFRPKEAKEAISSWKTEKAQDQLQQFQNTESLSGKFGFAVKNPSLITNAVVESLAPMLAGGVVGRGLGLAAKGIKPVAAAAIGEGVVGAGMTAEAIRQETPDGLLTPKQAALAGASGVTTGGFGYLGGKAAQKLGIADFDTAVVSGNRLAGGTVADAANVPAKGIARRTAEGALVEGVFEELPQSVSEQMLQNTALNKDVMEGVADAAVLGTLSGGLMGGVMGAATRNRPAAKSNQNETEVVPTEDMGQAPDDFGNPNRPSPVGLPNKQVAAQLGYGGTPSNQFNVSPDGQAFTGNQYNDYLSDQQAQARANRSTNPYRDINDISQAPQGYERFGSDPQLPPPSSTDFTAGSGGQVYGRQDINTKLQADQDADIARRGRLARGEILDRTPVPKLSEQMGLDPNKGSLSAAAALAVDSGASQVAAQDTAPSMTAWQSAMTDRMANADQNNETFARLADAINNEPVSVAEKARLIREAESLPRMDAEVKQIKPNTRVIDDARAQTRAYTPDGDEVRAQWDVVDASDLVTSNNDNFTVNPDFPSSRQPRDRTRATSQQQVNEIASKLQPNILGESADISSGAPFVGATDNVVDSGNGRSMAIRRAYQEGGEQAANYRQFVNAQAAKFGLDTDAINLMEAPVLVRRHVDDTINRDDFARAANKPTAARMSSTEQAASDAKNLPDASLLSFGAEGDLSLYQSQQYLKNFIAQMPSTEQASMMDDKGGLSREGKSRIEAAIVQDAYNNSGIVAAISEKLDNDSTNILRAVTDKAPQISQLNAAVKTGDAYNNTLARDIGDAAQAYLDLKNSEQDVNDYLQQDSLFGDGLTDGAKEILSVLSDNRRSAKAIGEYLQSRINEVTGRGNPKQGRLFDAPQTDASAATDKAIQLTEANPTVNIPAPKKPPRELSDKAMVREMQKPAIDSSQMDYKAKLNLSEGQDLGLLITATRALEDAVVTKTTDDKVTIEATVNGRRGSHTYPYETIDSALNNAKMYKEQQAKNAPTNQKTVAEKPKPSRANAIARAEKAIKADTEKSKGRLDHGELSIPNRTKNIDRELDKYKAEKARQDKREREDRQFLANEREAARKPARERAEELYKQHGKMLRALIKDRIYGTGNTPAEWLKIEAKVNPERFIKMVEQAVESEAQKADQNPKAKTPKPKFSRTAVKGATNTTTKQVIDKLSARFGDKTVQSLIDKGFLEVKTLSDFVGKDGRLTIPNDVDGLYHNGKATLIADNLSDDMIIPTFLHELGGHGGMQTLMSDKAYAGMMRDFDALVKGGDPLAVEAKAMADKVARNEQEAKDEYLPYLITLAARQQGKQGKIAGLINRMVIAIRSWLRDKVGLPLKVNAQDIMGIAERMVNEREKAAMQATDNVGTFDPSNNDIRFSRAANMSDPADPRVIAKETATRFYDWVSSKPPGKLSWWHKTIGTMYNLSQRNPYFKPVFENTEKFINDVSFYASKASEFAPRLLPQLDSIRDITKSAIGAKDNEALSKPIFEGTLLWGRDLNGEAVLIEEWRKKTMSASYQDRLQMLKNAGKITPAQEAKLATLNKIQANRFINGVIDDEVSAGLVWTDSELQSKFNLTDDQISLYREFRAATDASLDSLTRSDMLKKLGKDANAIEQAVMEAPNLRRALFEIEQHINALSAADPKRATALAKTFKDIKKSEGRTRDLMSKGYAPLSRFGQYTVDVVDADGNREYFGMFESAYEARKMREEMEALYGNDPDFTVTQGALSSEEFKLFAGVTPETAELFGEMLGLDSSGDSAADSAFQEYLRRTKNNRSAMKRLIHRKGIKGYSEDVGRVLASFIYSNARHTSAALNMSNIDRAITDIPKGEGQLKDAAVKLAEYIKNPQEEGNVIRGFMFAQYLGGSVASAAVNLTQPIAVSFPYLSQFGGAVKAASQLSQASRDWAKSLKNKNNNHFEPDLQDAIKRAEADGTLSPQEVHNLLKMAAGKNPLRAGDGTKVGDARAMASNTLSRISLGWGTLFSLAEQVNRRVTFVAAYRMAVDQGMDNPSEFASKSIKETQFVYNKASRMNWGRGSIGGTVMTFKTYTVSYIELMHRLWNQGEKGSMERAQGRKAAFIMLGTLFLLGGAGGMPFMEDAEDLIDGAAQIMGYNLSSKKARDDFLDGFFGETMGDFIESGISGLPGAPTDVSGRLGLGNLIPGTGVFRERTDNTRDAFEVFGPAGDFVTRSFGGGREILKGAANLDARQIGRGALELSPVAIRNAVQGGNMAATGMYKDKKGYKVVDISPIDAAFKAIGFQPKGVSKIQQANYINQSSAAYYDLKAASIRSLWAQGIVEKNPSKVADARKLVLEWNEKNPGQIIIIKPNDIARRVREMQMDKSERVTKLAPKSMRAQMTQDFQKIRDGV